MKRLLTIPLGILLLIATATPSFATQPDTVADNNRGTIKVDGWEWDEGKANESHVDCKFRIEAFDFLPGTLDVKFEGIPPSGGDILITDTLTVGPGLVTKNYHIVTEHMPKPEHKFGFHIKLTIGNKHKVLWVHCGQSPETTTTSRVTTTTVAPTTTTTVRSTTTTLPLTVSTGVPETTTTTIPAVVFGTVLTPSTTSTTTPQIESDSLAFSGSSTLLLGLLGIALTATGMVLKKIKNPL